MPDAHGRPNPRLEALLLGIGAAIAGAVVGGVFDHYLFNLCIRTCSVVLALPRNGRRRQPVGAATDREICCGRDRRTRIRSGRGDESLSKFAATELPADRM